MVCKKCGSIMPDDSKYCSKCGRKITPKLSFGIMLIFLLLCIFGSIIALLGLLIALALPIDGFIFVAIGIAFIICGIFYRKSAKKKIANDNSADTSPSYNKSNESTTYTIYRPSKFLYNQITPDYICKLTEPNTFVAFDLETTGLNQSCDEIIQIGAIKYENGIEIERFMSYVKPTISIPPQASRVNNIYDATVSDAPDIVPVLKKFIEFIGDYTLIAHNASFDMKFLQTHLSYNNLGTVENNVIDTLEIARRYLTLPNYKLPTIKEYYNIDVTMHEAVADCLVCSTLYLDYLDYIMPKYDEITDDIFKCFLVGYPDEIENMHCDLDKVCRLVGGRCYKTKAKSASYAIIISKSYQVSPTVKRYRDDGYKVANVEEALEYMSKRLEEINETSEDTDDAEESITQAKIKLSR